jgi:D-3-phosphoglycerate dehydrogenase
MSDDLEGPVVLVTSRSFSTGDLDLRAELEAAGVTVLTGPPDHDLGFLGPQLSTAVAWVAGTGPVTTDHLDAAPRLRLVARYGVGVEAVDLEAATQRGIAVTNTPGANSSAVADHALALMLGALRQVVLGDRRVRAGDWRVRRSRQLGQLTVGIVGVGRIGREVATRLSGFGSRVLGHDPWVLDADLTAAGIEPVSMPELLDRSDIITLHTPGEHPVVDAAWLGQVRAGVILVNTARASLVDEAALARALADRTVAGYAADTLSSESGPGSAQALLDEALSDRTIFTPHWAAQTVGAVDNMGRGAVDAVVALLTGQALPNLLNPAVLTSRHD